MPLVRTATAELVTVNLGGIGAVETIVVTSDPITLPAGTVTVAIDAWCQLTIGAGVASVTPRVRRGTLVADPLVGEANVEAVKGAAGSNEPFELLLADVLAGGVTVQYLLSVQPNAAGPTTMLQAGIQVLAIV